jgi:inositol transport system ATP-binding protein
MSDPILRVSGLSKSFSGVKALDNVQFVLKRGEVHALMGENGAGKSTFMKILIGLLKPDSGEILFEGSELVANGVSDMLGKGISMIHQEMLAVPELTVAQNIFLGREKQAGNKRSFFLGWLNDTEINRKAGALMEQLGVAITPETRMRDLTVAQMQMVEIARAISNDAKVIIMDEPTSAISDREVATLFRIIRDLKAKGVSIIYISHKMDEIAQIADTVTVMRDGKYIGSKPASALDQASLINMMVGRELNQMFPEFRGRLGEVMLEVKNLSSAGAFSGITFQVRSGEILGLAGLMGAGRTEIARVIFGLDKAENGQIILEGQDKSISSPREALRRGIGYVSEDRKKLGFVPSMSVKENITLASLRKSSKQGFVNEDLESFTADQIILDLRIKTAGLEQQVRHLSGGNQQKVVIGKVLAVSPKVIILDEPTRGVDVGAKFEIYKLIRNLADQGLAILMISSELPEILGMSDRILVLSKGKQTALLSKEEATQELIMKYAVA